MEIYFKIKNNLYYRITDGRCASINTETYVYKDLISLPSGKASDVKIITKEDFKEAMKIIGL